MFRVRTLASLSVSIVLALSAGLAAQQNPPPAGDAGTSAFESYIELLRVQTGIPGISGALLQDGQIVWERGLGFADQESRVRAAPDTPYPVGGISQALAAVLLLQCVEQRHLELDAPVERYGLTLPQGRATLRAVLSHTSSAPAGAAFLYDPERYAQLTAVMERCAPQPYRKSVAHRLLERLAMVDSIPGMDIFQPNAAPDGLFESSSMRRYAASLERMAIPYRVDRRGRASPTEVRPEGMNAASGLVSTVRDLARFDAALDGGVLLKGSTLAEAWSPATGAEALRAPTGLGWFVQSYRGTTVVWQFGVIPDAYSALIVKVPARRATMILLANSDGLASPYQLETGDITRSLFAAVFLRMLL